MAIVGRAGEIHARTRNFEVTRREGNAEDLELANLSLYCPRKRIRRSPSPIHPWQERKYRNLVHFAITVVLKYFYDQLFLSFLIATLLM